MTESLPWIVAVEEWRTLSWDARDIPSSTMPLYTSPYRHAHHTLPSSFAPLRSLYDSRLKSSFFTFHANPPLMPWTRSHKATLRYRVASTPFTNYNTVRFVRKRLIIGVGWAIARLAARTCFEETNNVIAWKKRKTRSRNILRSSRGMCLDFRFQRVTFTAKPHSCSL